jgi:hypothetical protein
MEIFCIGAEMLKRRKIFFGLAGNLKEGIFKVKMERRHLHTVNHEPLRH